MQAIRQACEGTGASPTKDRAGWLKARRGLIGASDVAAIMGLETGPTGKVWRSALEVYADKIGMGDEDAAGELALWGLLLEPVILVEYGRRRERKVLPGGELVRSKRYPFLGCTPDGWELPDSATIQIKTTGWGEEWKDDIPLRVQVQVQAELLVTDAPRAVVVWLPLPERRLQWREVYPHQAFQQAVLNETGQFWERVINRLPPPPDGSESSDDALRRLYPEDDGSRVKLADEWLGLTDEYRRVGEALKVAEARKREIKQQLAAVLGPATHGELPDGRAWSYKAQSKTLYTCEGCGAAPRSEPFRVARLHEPKVNGKRGRR